MANYYNLVGYRQTGFNFYNRPTSREVMAKDEFYSSGNYFQMKGIQVNREDMAGITAIKVAGSVKDMRGEQINPPNETGKIGSNGPWYDWENVDYVRLSRTGYPGDDDYVDISGDMRRPWITGVQVGFYFVTKVEATARNVTTLYLAYDAWTSLGGTDNLEIIELTKSQGPITDAEDAASFNLAQEPVGLIEPMVTKNFSWINREKIDQGTKDDFKFLVSDVDLTYYTEDEAFELLNLKRDGEIVQNTSLPAVHQNGLVTKSMAFPPETLNRVSTEIAKGFFNPQHVRVIHNAELLRSIGVNSFSASYRVPSIYMSENESENGRYRVVSGIQNTGPLKIDDNFGSYPRKANYMFKKACIFNSISGEFNSQYIYDLEKGDYDGSVPTDYRYVIWSIPTPGGAPFCRFGRIKGHVAAYDQAVRGGTWYNEQITIEGASGSLLNSINASFQQQELDRQIEQAKVNNRITDERRGIAEERYAINTAGNIMNGLGNLAMPWSLSQATTVVTGAANFYQDMREMTLNQNAEEYRRQFEAESFRQKQNEINFDLYQKNIEEPFVQFSQQLDAGSYSENIFGYYEIDITDNDKDRLSTYFKKFGYNGLYKKMVDWSELNVKQKVNYFRASSAHIKSNSYPWRYTQQIDQLLIDGCFFWNVKPSASAFDDNPDN